MDIVTRREAARDHTLKYLELSDQQLARSYGPGKWPVRFILHHLADAGPSIRIRGQGASTIRR